MSGAGGDHSRDFYLDLIDEVFGEIFFLFGGAFNVRMEISPETSLVGALFSPRTEDIVDSAAAVDFELSTCECAGKWISDPVEYAGIPVRTSSALELFDSIFCLRTEVFCTVDFSVNSWIVVIDG